MKKKPLRVRTQQSDIHGAFHGWSCGGVIAATDLRSRIDDCPHYTDERYSGGKTHIVFGDDSDKTMSYIYDDRMREWDHEKSQRAWKAVTGHDPPYCWVPPTVPPQLLR